MKKYILGLTIVSMLATVNTGIAMEKKKKEMPETSLSHKQVAELRKAVENYKKNRDPQNQKNIINKYGNDYPHDSFVKAKLNEITKFDNPQQSEVRGMPSAQQPAKEKTPIKEQPTEGKSNLRITNRESKRIEVDVHYSSYTLADMLTNGTKIINPQETIVMSVPEADRRDMSINVYVLDSSMNRYKGYSDIFRERIKKGQMLDLVYEDDHKYYPPIKDKYGEYYSSSKSAPHLYEIRK